MRGYNILATTGTFMLGVGKGAISPIVHPVETAKGMTGIVTHPVETAKGIVESFTYDPIGSSGELAGSIATFELGGKAIGKGFGFDTGKAVIAKPPKAKPKPKVKPKPKPKTKLPILEKSFVIDRT